MLKAIDTPNAPKPFSDYAQGIAVAPGAPAALRFGTGRRHASAATSRTMPAASTNWPGRMPWPSSRPRAWTTAMWWMPMSTSRIATTSALYREMRDRMLKGHKPAATLLIVAGLADQRLVVEVDLVAAAGGSGPGHMSRSR